MMYLEFTCGVFNLRYLDFAGQYGFTPRACSVRQAHEKGRVENGVGYVKKNFLAGLELPNSVSAMNTAARLDNIANVRVHKETRQRPCDLFAQEKTVLLPLPADTGVTLLVRATNQCLYHAQNLIATHSCSYEKHRDFENPDHVKELLDQRHRAPGAKSFYTLSPKAGV